MPVRKIPKSFRAVTGRFPSLINDRCISYESKLEHDYYLTLEFDRSIKCYEEQPLEIPGTVNGRQVRYIPDCLITFKDSRPQLLVECKYSTELQDDNEKLQIKIARLHEYAQQNRLEFRVITENDIQAAYLNNCLRLYRYAKPPQNIAESGSQIFKILKKKHETTISGLLSELGTNAREQANFTPAIWHLLFTGMITTDLNTLITPNSVLRSTDGQDTFTQTRL